MVWVLSVQMLANTLLLLDKMEIKLACRKKWYYFASSSECSRDLWVICLHYLMHSEKVFLITFLLQILSL